MAEKKENTVTPLMKQYNSIKAKYPDALLLFRVGDFYETFGEDAIEASKILNIVLTKRANGKAAYIELAGFPHHSIDTYLPKLVKAGRRVAICDQLEDPKLTKTIVKRGVTELVTPGVSYNDKILEQKENNFLASLHFNPKESGISFLDISTGEFFVAEGSNEYIDKLLQSFKPNEIIIQKNKRQKFEELFGNKFYINTFEEWVFTQDFTYDLLIKHFKTNSLKGYGIEGLSNAIIAAGAALHYLAETHHDKVEHIISLSRIEEDHFVWLDKFTIRNLEILHTYNEGASTLVDVLDNTITPMGSRMLKRWVTLPLKNKAAITERFEVVDLMISNEDLAAQLKAEFEKIYDLERLISKVATTKVNPRELVQLKLALFAVENIKDACVSQDIIPLKTLGNQLDCCLDIRTRLENEINEDSPVQLIKGNVIKKGVSQELDELRDLSFSGKSFLKEIQEREIERTGISSLKIGYNNVFGYYLEVTHKHRDKVPEEWHRKQTLINSERYITEELKEYEQKILGAEEKIGVLEANLFANLLLSLNSSIRQIQLNANIIARLDCLLSFANSAIKYNYCKPEINDSYVIDIKDGRHPVIEQHLPIGEEYITNDVYLDNENQQIIIITGPNMSGKSALLRQTALIVLMAQIGSFVPASTASIGLIDKIFTRVGASDNITSGESTFMVEMNETASILNNISNRSLILLDEIGRGTSTYDGISIAWAISEFLHNHPLFKAKVLFATHYHELNEMASSMPRIKNYHISIKEVGNKVIFLRKMKEGGSEHSFGIHVARMAGMPNSVLEKAESLLAQLEKSHSSEALTQSVSKNKNKLTEEDQYQLSFIQLDDPLLFQIKDDILKTNIDTLTPIEALMKLNEIKKLLGGDA